MKKITVLVVIFLAGKYATAQTNYKIGLAGNYITNDYTDSHLYDYLCPSFNNGVLILKGKRTNVWLENETLFRFSSKKPAYHELETKSAFLDAMPIVLGIQLNKKFQIEFGAGAAYIYQHHDVKYAYSETESGYYYDLLLGFRFSNKNVLNFLRESSIRLNSFRPMTGNQFSGSISFVSFLKF